MWQQWRGAGIQVGTPELSWGGGRDVKGQQLPAAPWRVSF